MKKALRLTGIVLAILLFLCLLMEIFAPGLPLYLKLKHEFPEIDEKIDTYPYNDTKVPDRFIKKRTGEFYISIPPECAYNDKMLAKSDKLTILATGTSLPVQSVVYSGNPCYQFAQKEYEHFYKRIGCEPPRDDREMRILIRDSINLEQCLHLRGKDRKIYKEFVAAKKTVMGIEKLHFFSHNGIEGFIAEVGGGNYNKGKYKYYWNIDVFVDDQEYLISTLSNDIELSKQVIASLELAS